MARNSVRKLRRFGSLPLRDQWLLLEAVLLLFVIQVCLRIIPFSSLRDSLDVVPSVLDGSFTPSCPRERISWAIENGTSILPGTYMCLVRALAGELLLVRRGYPATVQFGVDPSDEEFVAHAWVESDGYVIVGDTARSKFTPFTD